MRGAVLYMVFLGFLSSFPAFGQGEGNLNLRDSLSETTLHDRVMEAKKLHESGLVEESLKKGMEIISSRQELTRIDSFYTYQILAHNFRDLQADVPALEYAQKAVKVMRGMSPDNTADITWIAAYYFAVANYDSAIVYMKMDLSRFADRSDTLNLLKRYNDIGFTYYLNMQTDSAITYYHKVIDSGVRGETYDGVIGLVTGNLGMIHFNNGEYSKALELLKIDAELNKNRDPDSYFNAMNAIGECYLLMGDDAKAKAALLKIVDFSPSRAKSKLKTYDLLAQTYEQTGDLRQSLNYLKKHIALDRDLVQSGTRIETIMAQLAASKVSGIQKDLEISKSKVDLMNAELSLTRNEVRAQIFKARVNLALAVLLIIVVVITVIGYRFRQRKNKEIHRLETELIGTELKSKKQDLTNVVTNLTYMREFVDSIQNKLKEIRHEADGPNREKISALIREVATYQNTDKTIAVLQSDIDKVNLAFFKKLDEKFPSLTQNEKELCGLLLLKLSSKDIAVIRNVTPNAVKKARQRIRKKLPIKEDQKITAFLRNI